MRVGYHVEGALRSVQDSGWWNEREISIFFRGHSYAFTGLRPAAACESVRKEYDEPGMLFTRRFIGLPGW